MKGEQDVVCTLLNVDIADDLELPKTLITLYFLANVRLSVCRR